MSTPEPLVDGGARVERRSPLLPDLTGAATLYMQLLISGSVARFPIGQLQARAAAPGADDRTRRDPHVDARARPVRE